MQSKRPGLRCSPRKACSLSVAPAAALPPARWGFGCAFVLFSLRACAALAPRSRYFRCARARLLLRASVALSARPRSPFPSLVRSSEASAFVLSALISVPPTSRIPRRTLAWEPPWGHESAHHHVYSLHAPVLPSSAPAPPAVVCADLPRRRPASTRLVVVVIGGVSSASLVRARGGGGGLASAGSGRASWRKGNRGLWRPTTRSPFPTVVRHAGKEGGAHR